MYYGVDQNDIMRTEAFPLAYRYLLRTALDAFSSAVGEGRTEINQAISTIAETAARERWNICVPATG